MESPRQSPLGIARLARQGAGVLFGHAVARLYEELTGERPAKSPVELLRRLDEEDRLTPEAMLHLMALARALEQAGATIGGLRDLGAGLGKSFGRMVGRNVHERLNKTLGMPIEAASEPRSDDPWQEMRTLVGGPLRRLTGQTR